MHLLSVSRPRYALKALLDGRRTMGFEEADAAAAMRSIGEVGGEGRERKEALVNAAVEWICLNVPDERLPDEYASAGAQITGAHLYVGSSSRL